VIDWLPYRDYAIRLAARFKPSGLMEQEDYEAVALEALWEASKRYDPDGGVKFTTYAYHYIIGACHRALRDTSGVSGWAYERGVRFTALQWPSSDDVDMDRIDAMRDHGENVENTVEERETANILWKEVDKLGGSRAGKIERNQKNILRLIYRDGESVASAGRKCGLSRETARLCHNTALSRLRETPEVVRLAKD